MVVHPSSGDNNKKRQAVFQFNAPLPTKPRARPRDGTSTKSIVTMLRRTLEELVEQRHSRFHKAIETSIKTKEEKHYVDMYWALWLYEAGIPFYIVASRQFEIALEAIAQSGSGRRRHLINFLLNSPKGTYFLESIDASSEVHDAQMLADLLEERIEKIGKNKVVVITDNGANYKAARRVLMERIPTLFWSPCAAHCLDLMLEDIGDLKQFKKPITRVKHVTTFIYRGRILSAMREKTGGNDLVRSTATRFAASFLTLKSMYKHKDILMFLFVFEAWVGNKLSRIKARQDVHDIALSMEFWNPIEECLRASAPLLIVLRVVDGDEKPIMLDVVTLMTHAKDKIKASFNVQSRNRLVKNIMDIIERRWMTQMDHPLLGAALYLNPGKFFKLVKEDDATIRHLRGSFLDVLGKTVEDEEVRDKINAQSINYECQIGDAFSTKMAKQNIETMYPLDWCCSYGGRAVELQRFARCIVSLCASSSGYERN
uniref:DUF659 domain-containing protein n=1 Tax=Oryza brachyantha TaxID=4533 RepID=J3N7D6_ORYBR